MANFTLADSLWQNAVRSSLPPQFLLGLLALLTSVAAADAPNPQRQQELLNLLKHDCGSCHGLPPKGGLGPSLMPDALASKSDELLLDAIQNGRPATAMPPWRQFLTLDDSRWLLKQLRQPP